MRVLITAGPTREPIDAVRYLGNRSSGRMGAALATAALSEGHAVTLIVGPVSVAMPLDTKRINVETAAQMHAAVLSEFPDHELLIMSAAVADYRPKIVHAGKLAREGSLTIECEATADIIADASHLKRSHQRTIGFSLERRGNIERSREKLIQKKLDLIVYNPTESMDSEFVDPALLWPDGRVELPGALTKVGFAEVLMARAASLF